GPPGEGRAGLGGGGGGPGQRRPPRAGGGEAKAMPTQEIAPPPVELADPAPAGHAVDHAWADEIWPRSAEATGQADDADGLRHILPTAAADADAIGQMQLISLSAQINRGDFFPVAAPFPTNVATPFPTPGPTGAKAARLVQSVHVYQATAFRCDVPRVRPP